MKNLKKAIALILGIAAIFSLAACGGASPDGNDGNDPSASTDKKYTIMLGSDVSPATKYYEIQQWFKSEVEAKTNGQVTVQLYPSSQLGSNAAMVEQVQQGTLDMVAVLSSGLQGIVPSWSVLDMPFLVSDNESAEELLNGPVGEKLMSDLDAAGIKGLGFYSYGFRQMYNNVHPIESMADIKGLKIRVASKPLIETFTAWGANTTSTPWSELYTSVSSGALDGFDLPLVNLINNSMQEVVDYCTISNHVFSAGAWTISKKTLDKLPQEFADIVVDVASQACTKYTEATKEAEANCITVLEEADVQITYLSEEATAELAAKCAAVLENHKSDFGEEIYNLVAGNR